MRAHALRRLGAALGIAAALGAGAVWAIPGDFFGDYRILQKGDHPRILAFNNLGEGSRPDVATFFRLEYLAGPDCFVSETPGMDADKERRPIIWPPGSRVVRAHGRIGVSVPKGGMIWSSFTRTTFWVGDIVEGAPGTFQPYGLAGPIPVLDKDCCGSERGRTGFEALDEAYAPGHYALFRWQRRVQELEGRLPSSPG